MIVISVRAPEDVPRAQAFGALVRPRHEILVLAHEPALRALCEARALPVSDDPWELLLNAQRVSLFASLWASSADRHYAELALLAAFDDLGIPTLALQRAPLQPGFHSGEGASLLLCGATPGAVEPHSIACAARFALGFALAPHVPAPASLGGALLVCTDLHAPHYDEPARHRFALSLVALCAARPELRIVWCPDPGEASHPGAVALSALVASYELPNLEIEPTRFAEELAYAGVRAALCGLGAPLLALEKGGVPCLVYASAAQRAALTVTCFEGPDDLLAQLDALLDAGQRFVPRTGWPTLDPHALQAELQRILATRALVPGHLARALQHVQRLNAQPAAAVAAPPVSLGPILFELRRVLEKLGVVQRSTLAYKAKRLARRLRPR